MPRPVRRIAGTRRPPPRAVGVEATAARPRIYAAAMNEAKMPSTPSGADQHEMDPRPRRPRAQPERVWISTCPSDGHRLHRGSGSGKSSLVFSTIAAESQRLINETTAPSSKASCRRSIARTWTCSKA